MARWSREEDALLSSLYDIYGKQWKVIASHFPTKTCDSVRNKIRRKEAFCPCKPSKSLVGRKPWTFEEDMYIVQMAKQSPVCWKMAAMQLGRSYNGVRNRYARLAECKTSYALLCMCATL